MLPLRGMNPLKELVIFASDLYKKEYPSFLYGKKELSDIPVFCYHHVTHGEFESHLVHLEMNEYNTVSGDEYYEALKTGEQHSGRSVLLTFDDGMSDVYDVVFPLLKKYFMKIVVFLIPAWIGREGMLTWEQVQEMHESGLVDFQSHSMHHPAIFVSPEVVDYYRPNMTKLKDWNVPAISEDGKIKYCEKPSAGQPIYGFHSRFSELPRFVPDEKLQTQSQVYVEANGGESFFGQKMWRENLNKNLDEWREKNNLSERFESIGEQVNSIRMELEKSKELIEDKLPGKNIQYFACPWNVSSALTHQLLREAGYRISFVGIKLHPDWESESPDFYCVKRISGDFVKCLPGQGRQSLFSVVFSKMKRRVLSGVNY